MRPTSLRRRAAYGGVSAALLAAGLVPLVASAAGSPCPTYADPAGDAAPLSAGLFPVIGDPSLDLVAVTHSTGKGVLSTTVQVAGLQEGGPKHSFGDWFEVAFTVAEKPVVMRAIRDTDARKETTTRIQVGGVTQEFAPVATYDFAAGTVRLDVKLADLQKAVGAPLKGATFSGMSASTFGYYLAPGLRWDTAAAGEGVAYTVGDACKAAPAKKPAAAPSAGASPSAGPSASPSGGASPDGSPKPSASASASPAASASPSPAASPAPPPPQPTVPVPADGCRGLTDVKGDGRPSAGPASPGNDPHLDLLAVTGRTTADVVAGHLQLDKLGAKPSFGGFTGHRFEYSFTLGGKVVVLRAEAEGRGVALVDGAVASDVKVNGLFDTVSSQVVLTADRETLAAATGASTADGALMTDLAGSSFARNAAGAFPADRAVAASPEQNRYTIGDSSCFTPRLSVSSPPRVQTSDLAPISVAIVTSDGRPAAGQTVTARIGNGRAVAAKTDEQGTANLAVPVSVAAGARELVVRSAGSAGDGLLRSAVRVLEERSVLSVASSGAGADRTVTAVLVDDDRRPLVGQRLVFTVAGRTVSATTDRAGRASVQAPAGSAVDVAFAGRRGFLSSARARTTA